MVPCLVLGDSIAVGVGLASPHCQTFARVGIGSGAYVASLFPTATKTADSAVISLGVNDDPAAHTLSNLRLLRSALVVRTVTWLLPGLKPAVRAAIQTVAAEHHDRLVDTRPQAGPDHLHPTGAGYRRIAAQIAEPGAAPAAAPVVSAFSLTSPAQWLPPSGPGIAHAGFQQGARFRLWVPPGTPTALAFR